MFRLLIIPILLALLAMAGCSGGGGSESSGQTPLSESSQNSNQKVDITISLEGLLSSRISQSSSRVRKALFPNLGALRLEITADGLEPIILDFSPSSKTANVQLNVGFRYSIRVLALDSSGVTIAEGNANLDLLVAPQAGQSPNVTVKLQTVNPSNIRASLWPDGGNILPGQPVYAYLNQEGRIHYKINDGEFQVLENVPSTAGQNTTIHNGIPIEIPGNAGDLVNLKFIGEDLEGRTAPIESADYSILLPTSFQPIDVAVVKSTRMTSTDFEVFQVIPVHRDSN